MQDHIGRLEQTATQLLDRLLCCAVLSNNNTHLQHVYDDVDNEDGSNAASRYYYQFYKRPEPYGDDDNNSILMTKSMMILEDDDEDEDDLGEVPPPPPHRDSSHATTTAVRQPHFSHSTSQSSNSSMESRHPKEAPVGRDHSRTPVTCNIRRIRHMPQQQQQDGYAERQSPPPQSLVDYCSSSSSSPTPRPPLSLVDYCSSSSSSPTPRCRMTTLPRHTQLSNGSIVLDGSHAPSSPKRHPYHHNQRRGGAGADSSRQYHCGVSANRHSTPLSPLQSSMSPLSSSSSSLSPLSDFNDHHYYCNDGDNNSKGSGRRIIRPTQSRGDGTASTVSMSSAGWASNSSFSASLSSPMDLLAAARPGTAKLNGNPWPPPRSLARVEQDDEVIDEEEDHFCNQPAQTFLPIRDNDEDVPLAPVVIAASPPRASTTLRPARRPPLPYSSRRTRRGGGGNNTVDNDDGIVLVGERYYPLSEWRQMQQEIDLATLQSSSREVYHC